MNPTALLQILPPTGRIETTGTPVILVQFADEPDTLYPARHITHGWVAFVDGVLADGSEILCNAPLADVALLGGWAALLRHVRRSTGRLPRVAPRGHRVDA